MGSVFRKTATKPLPAGARIIVRKGQRLAEWIDAKKKRRTAPVTKGRDGSTRIVVVARTFTAKFRDGAGIVRETATGCRDESAARSILTELEKRAEKVRGGILSSSEDAAIDYQREAIIDHIADFISRQRARGLSRRVNDTDSQLRRVVCDCAWGRLSDIDASAFDRWLLTRGGAGMAAATRNEYRSAWVTFCNWCVAEGRLVANPIIRVPKANVAVDRRRERRALTLDEAARLLRAAELRPVAEHGRATIARGGAEKRANRRSRRTWQRDPLTWENLEEATAKGRERLKPYARERLERKGRERRMVYRLALATGMRRGEVRKLAIGWIQDIDGPSPAIVIRASDEKSRRGAVLPLRADVAAELRDWLDERFGVPAEVLAFPSVGRPVRDAQARIFDTVPAIRAFDLDLQAASIPKTDDRGRVVDFHSLRGTFASWLSAAGVAPRVAQAAMRHSTINLTMNTYTDPRLLDVAGAVESLPALPPAGSSQQAAAAKATGTDDHSADEFAPKFALRMGKRGTLGAIADNVAADRGGKADAGTLAVSRCGDKRKDPLSTTGNGSLDWAMTDSNRRHPRCKRGALTN